MASLLFEDVVPPTWAPLPAVPATPCPLPVSSGTTTASCASIGAVAVGHCDITHVPANCSMGGRVPKGQSKSFDMVYVFLLLLDVHVCV